MSRVYCLLLSAVLCAVGFTRIARTDEKIDYARQVKPILKERCFACHASLKQQANLRLDSGDFVRKGGESGPAIEAGSAEKSLLIERISAADETRMPQEGKPLTPQQIATLKTWIDQGAVFPADDKPEPDPRDHWAFRAPVRPAVPAANDPAWSQNPIDAFLAAEHEKHGLTYSPPADKATLLRRVHLDLVGLPPTRQELRAFLADDSPDAYAKVVNKMLESPQYGERWARHWMDVWRYSDWYGRRSVPDVMNSYPMIWQWRDWIVRSLNEDKGYDRMVQEMLAADEIAPGDDANVVATGFVVRNWFKWNYNTWMRDQVEHTGKAFLGLTLNCCHCHDHKYDPISQEEYFKFRAFFEPLELRHDRVAGEADPGPFQKYVYAKSYGPISSGMIRVFDEKLDAKTFMYVKGDERNKVADKPPLEAGVPAALGGTLKVEPIELPPAAYYPGMRDFVRSEEQARCRQKIAAAESAAQAAREPWEEKRTALEVAVAAADALLQKAIADARSAAPAENPDGKTLALSGAQWLRLDAAKGRRLLGHKLGGLQPLADKGSISFQLAIVQDQHFNFQLGLDIDKGLTGAFVSFDKGSIRTYPPGRDKFEDGEVGKYDLAAGQNRFQVTLVLDTQAGLCRLTVNSLSDGKLLVDNVASETHGWQPIADGKRGIFLDARPGTVVLIDEFVFAQSTGEVALKFDFEPPQSADAKDVAGIEGWIATSFCEAPATSHVVSNISGHPQVTKAAEALRLAQVNRDAVKLPQAAAEAQIAAAQAEMASLEARIAADNAKYGLDAELAPRTTELVQVAAGSELAAKVAQANAALAAAESAVASAEIPPAPTGDAAKDVQQAQQHKAARDKAQQQLATARQARDAAQAAQDAKDYTPLSPLYPKQSTGRRAALARWITDRENPLTARVAVNHIWNWHFGRPLVETTANFGRNGKPPSHPELLDWLAVELMEHGWKMKHIHKLIVTSRAYQQSSSPPLLKGRQRGSENIVRDRDNRWLWRFNPARMDAEVVRDGLLHAAGELELTLGGPDIDYAQGLSSRRRSLYFTHHGESKMEFLELFDAANPCDCYQRTMSVAPQQALALVNNEMTIGLSRKLAGKLWTEIAGTQGTPEAHEITFVTAAFEQVLSRSPTEQELAVARKFLEKQRAAVQEVNSNSASPAKEGQVAPSTDPQQRAREGLVQALFSHNDFVAVR